MRAKWAALWDFLRGIPPVRCLRVALLIWVVYAGVISALVAVDPKGHSATLEYQRATGNWWSGKTLYRSRNGYLYLPQFAVLYTPFEMLPDRVGEPLWRLACMGSLAWALWAAASRLAPEKKAAVFLVATVLVLPSSFASARNGQVNMPLAACFLLTALALARERWWWASVFLAIALALKPISLAPVLLCGVLYPRLRLPLLVSLAIMAVAPLAHFNPAYAAGEYSAFARNLGQAGNPKGQSWCDFAGMLRVFRVDLPSSLQLVIRALAGVLALGLCWKARKGSDALRAAFAFLFLSTIYLMLFNPRTETNSYVMLGAFVAVWAAVEGLVCRRPDIALWASLLAVLLGSENYGWPIFPVTNLWAKALATSVLGIWLAVRIMTTPPERAVLMDRRWIPGSARDPRAGVGDPPTGSVL
ncbi:MAG: glycosyltransferase family 87 protein [Terrimicrobiaceae bacterium]